MARFYSNALRHFATFAFTRLAAQRICRAFEQRWRFSLKSPVFAPTGLMTIKLRIRARSACADALRFVEGSVSSIWRLIKRYISVSADGVNLLLGEHGYKAKCVVSQAREIGAPQRLAAAFSGN